MKPRLQSILKQLKQLLFPYYNFLDLNKYVTWIDGIECIVRTVN